MNTLTIVVPVYNNQGSLNELHKEIRSLSFNKNIKVKLLFVNDGSVDESLMIIKELNKIDTDVQLISFTKNFGQIAAIKAGLEVAQKSEFAAIISADMQDPVNLIPEMLEHIDEKTDVVVAYRQERSDGLLSKVGSTMFYGLIHYYNSKVPTGGFDYALLKSKVIPHWLSIKGRHRFMQGDLLWLGFNTKFIPYHREERKKGFSQYKIGHKIKYFIDGFLHTSYSPIRWFSAIGLISLLVGIVFSISIVYNYFFNEVPFKGWAPLMILILILGGLNLCFLGILGEYIWRIFDNMNEKPDYIINEKID